MFCTAGTYIYFALTMVGVPEDADHQREALRCYPTMSKCETVLFPMQQALAMNGLYPEKITVQCEREPVKGGKPWSSRHKSRRME